MKNIKLHEMIQSYFDVLFAPFEDDIRFSKLPKGNQIYGELFYYSFVQLLEHLTITEEDHFLDIGSALGKIVFQMYFTTRVKTVTGIEINHARHVIASKIKTKMEYQLPDLFSTDRKIALIEGDFLDHSFDTVTLVYLCSTAFSYDLLQAVGKKINTLKNARNIISLRKIPSLSNFKITKKLFLAASWDNVACYIYTRK